MAVGAEVKKDGYAYCNECGKKIWTVPGKKKWAEGGYKPVAQELLHGAAFSHYMKEHPVLPKSDGESDRAE